MDGAFERVLRLVSEGRLTAAEAGPILDALAPARGDKMPGTAEADTGTGPGAGGAAGFSPDGATGSGPGAPRFARIEVRDGGKRVVDLRIPISLGRFALGRVPGLSAAHVADVEQAVASGSRGPILDVEDANGDGVRIVLE